MGGLARGLDALPWRARNRMAGRHLRARQARDVAGGVGRVIDWRAGPVPGDPEGLSLLLCQGGRKFAVADPQRKTFNEFRYCVFAIRSDQFGERRKQTGLRQAVAIDAIVPRFRPRLVQIAQRRLFLFVVGQWAARSGEGRWIAHEARQAVRDPGWNARLREV